MSDTGVFFLSFDIIRYILLRLGSPHEYYRIARQLCTKSRTVWVPKDVNVWYLVLIPDLAIGANDTGFKTRSVSWAHNKKITMFRTLIVSRETMTNVGYKYNVDVIMTNEFKRWTEKVLVGGAKVVYSREMTKTKCQSSSRFEVFWYKGLFPPVGNRLKCFYERNVNLLRLSPTPYREWIICNNVDGTCQRIVSVEKKSGAVHLVFEKEKYNTTITNTEQILVLGPRLLF